MFLIQVKLELIHQPGKRQGALLNGKPTTKVWRLLSYIEATITRSCSCACDMVSLHHYLRCLNGKPNSN